MKILFTGPVPEKIKTELGMLGHHVTSVAADAYVDEPKFCAGIRGFDVYVSGGLETCTRSVVESAHSLKAIIFLGTDYKAYIDADAAAANDIPIFNTPGTNARAVAELAFMLILLAVRKGTKMITDARQKTWQAQTGSELQGKTLGLVGAGNIAGHVANIGRGFGMKVLYWSRSGAKKDVSGQYETLDNVLAQSDVLSLHIPKEAGTVIDEKAFKKMRAGAVLVNTSPASLVDGNQLYSALKEDKLQTAAFDTFYAEGDAAWRCDQAKLLELGAEKFFVTPHAGWRTVEADNDMFMLAVEHIKKLSSG